MVNCNPYGGISNRMKCIISSIVEYGDINLLWNVPKSGGGVRCEFNDLYKNIFNGSTINSVSDCKFIHPKMNTHNEGGKDNLPADLKKRYIEVIKTLEPIDYITNKIKEEKDRLGDYSAVSVRTFKSFPAEYNSWGRYFKIDNPSPYNKIFYHTPPPSIYTTNSISIPPVKGGLIIFPSFLDHEVLPGGKNCVRTTLAINYQ